MSELRDTAVFYDLENCLAPGLGLGEIGRALKLRLPEHRFVARRAYANFAMGYASQVDEIQRQGVTTVQVFGAKPNAVDFEISLDAVRLVLSAAGISSVVIVSNDGDFLPLFRHLRELGSEVICALTKAQHHPLLATSAEVVLKLYETRPAAGPKTPGATDPKPGGAKPAWPAFRKLKPDTPSELFAEALESYLGHLLCYKLLKARLEREGLLVSELAQAIRLANPDFTAALYGFANFTQLLMYFFAQTDWGLFVSAGSKGPIRFCLLANVPEDYLAYEPFVAPPPDPLADLPAQTPAQALDSPIALSLAQTLGPEPLVLPEPETLSNPGVDEACDIEQLEAH